MLSERDNKLLAETGPGTPMGELFRRFWLPVLLSEELPEPDCVPVAIRILGEDLVAFRDSNGRVGVIEAYCQHRHAALFWGRNEDCGLRCTYHGWKYDVDGNCVDMPNEPAESIFKDKIHATAYPTREAGGCIWAYMGPPERMPPDLPQYEWVRVPDSHRLVTKRLQESNWAQAVEGGIDSSHVSFLHSTLPEMDSNGKVMEAITGAIERDRSMMQLMSSDRSPMFLTLPTDYGMLVGARRNAPDDQYYWRVTPYFQPSGTIIPGGGNELSGHVWVPIDDEHVWTFSMTWSAEEPLTRVEVDRQNLGLGIHTEVDKQSPRWDIATSNSYQPVRNQGNSYQLDRTEQRNRTFTGIKGISEQDMSIQESMGRVVPRWKEHLGTTDRGIIEFRRIMLQLARDLQEGREPAAAHHPEWYRVRSGSFLAHRSASWEQESLEHVAAHV
jgi:phenylpropionate dioxygenase-like ring-hydroxylating dioxygenase large terminal subunit